MTARTKTNALVLTVAIATVCAPKLTAQGFTFEQVRSYPFPTELTASATGSRIAWAFDEKGARNIYVAAGPDFTPRRLTNFLEDDGQELTSISISSDGRRVVYVRGGDHGSNWDDHVTVNVLNSPEPPTVEIFSVPFDGGEPKWDFICRHP